MASLELGKEQKETLIGIARQTVEATVKCTAIPDFKIKDPVLKTRAGAFVTICNQGNLRGCIGNIIAHTELFQTIRDMSVEAACHDPRFRPISEAELDKIDIEISVISPMEKIDDISVIEVGKHGLFIKQGYYQGLLLPQVATEYNWNREQFLEHTCMKAGLPKGCYKGKDCQIFIFSATVFGELEGIS